MASAMIASRSAPVGGVRRVQGSASRSALRAAVRPAAARRASVQARSSAISEEQQQALTTFCTISTASATLLSAGNAQAAQEIAQVAGDGRIGALLALLFPAVGWVLFNILGPTLNQLDNMSDKASKKGLAAGLGLGAASMLVAEQADAAQEIAQVAGDNRIGALLALLFPAVGWVLFNILGPTLNQLDSMSDKASKKGLAAGLGLGAASMLVAEQADAAQEIAQVAGDNRIGALLALLFPAVGWVLFNILGPTLNQLDNMSDKASKKGLAAGLGLGAASMLVAEQADAAQEIAQVAGDNRIGALLALLFPAVGWVLFNILGPTLNQLDNMSGKASKKGLAAGLGLGAASMLVAEQADAAQEIAQVAGDGRIGALLALLFPAVGWVLFNILGPTLNQLDNMSEKAKQ